MYREMSCRGLGLLRNQDSVDFGDYFWQRYKATDFPLLACVEFGGFLLD